MTLRLLTLLTALAFTSSAALAAAASLSSQACEREMARASEAFGIPLGVLYAVALTETGKRGSLQPLAMNIAGKAHYAKNLKDALQEFQAARKRGVELIDVGCMQVNHHFHGSAFNSVADMFDPHRNVTYAAGFLKQLRAREGSWTLAVARYHAGPNNNPAQKRYVCSVITNMVASGFGSWTDNARAFCDTTAQ